MKKLLPILFLISFNVFSQNDCSEAIIVCGNSGYSDLSATGFGTQELSSSNNCSSEESNSLWFKLIIKTGGTLGFTLTPNSSDINEDFDFFIFGPNATCNNLGFAIRCSTTNPASAGQGNNLTGMNNTETDTAEGPGENGNSFVSWLNVNAGDSYFLVIDRPIGNSNFKLEWTGTATFSDPPVINTASTVNNTLNLEECDGNDDQTAEFDLTINNSVIGSQTSVTATYHTSSNDATLGTNPIASPGSYSNTSNPQTVYIRLTNTVTECFSVGNFSLTVNENSKATQPSDYAVCDDDTSGSDTDGIYNQFLLKSKDQEVLNNLNANNYKVSYHSSLNGANTNTDIIDKNSNYTNVTTNEQTVYIRLENSNSPECLDTSQTLKLVVNSLPEINSVVELKQCDDDTDGITKFNLTEAESLITTNSGLTFTYYTNETSALNEDTSAQITNTSAYQNTQVSGQSVWVNVKNQNGCFRVSEIQLVVSTTQVPSNFLITYNECDDPSNTNTFDGITSFNISSAIQTITALFPSNQSLKINLYENLNDALAETNEITNLNSFRNTNSPNEQYLFVRIDNNLNNACLGLGQYIRLIVDQAPVFSVSTPQIVCLNASDLILEVENPNETYSYQWIKNNASTILGTSSTLTISNGGTYQVTAFNTTTNCSHTETIVVNESIKPTVSYSDIAVTDDSTNNSISINRNNLGIGDYEFALQNESGVLVNDYQDDAVFSNLSGGIYTVLIRDKNGCGITNIEVPVVEFPNFFTPNGDGINDVWTIKGANTKFFPQSSITIFNRFGKLLTSFNLAGSGWNGMYNGALLPSNDYWYNITLTNQEGIVKNKTGHFSLLRK